MIFNWENNNDKIKNEILYKYNILKIKNINEYINYDPYMMISDYDIFLFFAKLKFFEICIFWIKFGIYKNRYFKNGKSTLFYIINYIKNIKLIYEIFIYWNINQYYIDLLYYNENIDNYNEILIYYYLNNNICPCIIFKNEEHIKNALYLKSSHLCSDCIEIFLNNNHDCNSLLNNKLFNNKYIISFICQTINCNYCLNNFISKNVLSLKKKLIINNKSKNWINIVYYVDKIKNENGIFEDSIDIDNILENDKYYKCKSNVSHYYKYENWIRWSNYKNLKFCNECCICRAEMDGNLYINSENKNDLFYFNYKSYFQNLKNNKIDIKHYDNYIIAHCK